MKPPASCIAAASTVHSGGHATLMPRRIAAAKLMAEPDTPALAAPLMLAKAAAAALSTPYPIFPQRAAAAAAELASPSSCDSATMRRGGGHGARVATRDAPAGGARAAAGGDCDGQTAS